MRTKQPGVGFFGKVRLATVGHKAVIDTAKQIASKSGAKLHIGLSGTSYPLTPQMKKRWAEHVFQHPVETHHQNVVSFLSHLNKKHDDITLIAGSDRAEEYKNIISRYNGKKDSTGQVPFNFKKWRVHSITRNIGNDKKPPSQMRPDELVRNVSASKLEKLATSNNFKDFSAYYPGFDKGKVKELFNHIRASRKLQESYIGQTLSRDLMPQFDKQSIKGFQKELEKEGIDSQEKTVPSDTLKSSQLGFDKGKVTSMIGKKRENIVTSNDGHVLDGHHRWLADLASTGKTKTLEIDLPVLDLLAKSRTYLSRIHENKNNAFKSELPSDQYSDAFIDDLIDSFCVFSRGYLKIKSDPIVTKDSVTGTSFGSYNPHENKIGVNFKNRHILDSLRTLAHELVHVKQNEEGKIKDAYKEGQTGSPVEDEANSIAGRMMRDWGRAHPDCFEWKPLLENIAIYVLGGPCSGKDRIVKILKEESGIQDEYDLFRSTKASLPSRLIINGSADNFNNIWESMMRLNESGYHYSVVFVDVDNQVSQERNELRGKTGQRVLSESVRQDKFDKSRENMEKISNLLGENFLVVENNSKPKDREFGTTSLKNLYKKETPGQYTPKVVKGKQKQSSNPDNTKFLSSDGIGQTLGVQKSIGGFGAYSTPVYEWINKPEVIERFSRKYGKDAFKKLQEAATLFTKSEVIPVPRRLREIFLESDDLGIGDSMGTVPSQSKEDNRSELRDYISKVVRRKKNNK